MSEMNDIIGRWSLAAPFPTAVLDALSDGISIQTPDYRVVYQNRVHRKMSGKDAVGSCCYKVYSGQNEICEGCPVAKVLADGGSHRLTKQVDNGAVNHYIEISASPLRSVDGEVVAVIELVRDISRLKQAEAEVRELNRLLQDQADDLIRLNRDLEAFGFSLAHDLRSAMTPLILASDALESRSLERFDEKERYLLGVVSRTGLRLENMVTALLGLSRLGKVELNLARLDLSRLVADELQTLRVSYPERNFEFVIEPGLEVQGDAKLIQLVLQNLVQNAAKFSAEREVCRIVFGEEVRDQTRHFFFKDNGTGFDPLRASEIFLPFKRLHDQDSYAGDGVGLATVEKIIRRHGGKIFAESQEGQGACFYFTLPD